MISNFLIDYNDKHGNYIGPEHNKNKMSLNHTRYILAFLTMFFIISLIIYALKENSM